MAYATSEDTREFRDAISLASDAINQLSQLSQHENLDSEWTSMVTRAQTKVADSLRACKRSLRDLEELIEFSDRGDLQEAFFDAKESLKQLEERQVDVRQSVASASSRAASAQKQRLLSGAEPGIGSMKGGNAVAASENITASLRHSLRMLTEEIELSKGNTSLITNTTHKLTHAAREYSRQQDRIKKSRGLLSKISLLARQEDILLYCGIAVFAAACMYVVIRRSLHFIPELPRFNLFNEEQVYEEDL